LADEAFGKKGLIHYAERQELTSKFNEMLVKNLTIHGVVSTCCDETRKVNQFLKRPSKYCMTCSKELK